MDGGVAKVTGRGGLRQGRSVRGEHRIDEGERQPLPTSSIQQMVKMFGRGAVGRGAPAGGRTHAQEVVKEPKQGAALIRVEGVGQRFSEAGGLVEVRRWGMLSMPSVPGIDQQRHAAVQVGLHAKLVCII